MSGGTFDRATKAQVRYAFSLPERAEPGFSRIDERHVQRWGAPRERLGKSIDGWLVTMTVRDIGGLIDRLKEALGE